MMAFGKDIAEGNTEFVICNNRKACMIIKTNFPTIKRNKLRTLKNRYISEVSLNQVFSRMQ